VTRPTQPDPYADFLVRYPQYQSTLLLDRLRATEYGRLDDAGQIYLDYTGAGLHAASQVRQHAELLNAAAMGNPHSGSPASSRTTTLVEGARRAVLDWFGAADDYTAIFTLNATGALKHVAESYPFAPGGQLLLTADNHNSVNGIREFARAAGASIAYAPLTVPELRLDMPALDALLSTAVPDASNLLAFPAQSNFTGVRHPLELIERAHDRGWDVLLDAAAFVSTNRLDLRAVKPEFVCISFYKMFGYPTGVGCLLVRHSALETLKRPWFAGGTVNFASVGGHRHILADGEAGFEDGTLNYLSIAAVDIGLRQLASAGIDAIHMRVDCLTSWLLEELLALRHSTGRPMVRIYGPMTTAMRGGIVTMNFYDPEGHLLDYRRVEEMAGQHGISLRTGCFCNPGTGETAEGITREDIAAALTRNPDLTLPLFLQMIAHEGGKTAGAIRVSFGIASNFADAQRFVEFAAGLRDQTRLTIGEASFDIESCRIIRDGS
jgi:molybdenum cofactor sulfurtransferase